MSLRDYFAVRMMQIILTETGLWDNLDEHSDQDRLQHARVAYAYAAALLKARSE